MSEAERLRLAARPDSDEAPEAVQRADQEAAKRILEAEDVHTPVESQGGGQFDGWPLWAKIGVTASAVSIISGLCVYLTVAAVHNQRAGADLAERLMDKFDRTLEKHDDRQRDWMRAHGDVIRAENERTRADVRESSLRQEKFQSELSRLHEEQLKVLRQIRDEKRMP